MNRLLRRIELAGERHMRGGEVSNDFWIFDHPDGAIVIGHKDGSLGFPFRVPDRSTSTPTFLHAIRAAGLGVWAAQLSSLIQPARKAFFCCADSELSATRPQPAKKTKTTPPLVILSFSCLRNPRSRLPHPPG
jgi:hypothetical protein